MPPPPKTTGEPPRPSAPPGDWAEHAPDAAAQVASAFSLGKESVVVDLAAGLGRWTRLLLPTRATLIAIEPDDALRYRFGELLPTVLIAPGAPDFIPLPDETIDVVTCAQSFHRFDASRALPEIRRKLVPAGGLALVWSWPDRSVEWVGLLAECLEGSGAALPRAPEDCGLAALSSSGGFTPIESASYRHVRSMSAAALLERVGALARGRRAVVGEARRLIEKHPETAGRPLVELPYRTELHRCRKR
ncbi:MAG: class I SAM-dependent methyltransferase [Elusimicrobia bacterium]|nr:class I SAM-dependent methyltransferase [Elusimicrobiota bacterium]